MDGDRVSVRVVAVQAVTVAGVEAQRLANEAGTIPVL